MHIFGTPSLIDVAHLATRHAITYFVLPAVARVLPRRLPEPGNRDFERLEKRLPPTS
jgi:hypothetical protein